MNKMKCLKGAVALLCLSVSAAYATTTTVKNFDVTGNITQQGCQLEPTQDVSFTSVSFDKLEDAATVKARTGIGLNATFISLTASNCTAGQVTATVTGTADTDATLLAIDSDTNAAQNVAIAFSAQDTSGVMKFLSLNTGQTAPATGNGQYDLDHQFMFAVEPVKTSTTAQPGKIHATAQIHINYL